MAGKGGNKLNMWQQKKAVINAMYDDVIRGKQKFQVREKFFEQGYNNDAITHVSFCKYWNEMLEKFAEEFEKNKEDLKSKFIARYMYLYEMNIAKGKYKEAKEVLDSIAKMTGANEPEEMKIDFENFTIDFGLDNIVKDGK